MAPAGRRRRAAGPSTRRYQEPQTFTLPLHPARMHEAVAAADSGTLHEVVGSEYVTKYLERIGAKPTRANAELVRKHLPLSDDNVKASFKARGALSDELTVTLPKFQGGESRAAVSKAGSRARANQVLLFGMLTRATEDGNEGDREDDAAAVGGLAAGPSVGGAAAVGAAPMTSPKGGLESERRRGFQELSKKYVFPFRLEAEEKAAAAKGKARQSCLVRPPPP